MGDSGLLHFQGYGNCSHTQFLLLKKKEDRDPGRVTDNLKKLASAWIEFLSSIDGVGVSIGTPSPSYE